MTAAPRTRSRCASQNECSPRAWPDTPDTRFPANLMRREPNAFWTYSLKLYGVAAVADACLKLQDRWGADVNLLLLCCWRGSLGHALSKSYLREAIEAVAGWQHQVVVPLRQTRRFVKTGIPSMPMEWKEQLRKNLAAVELDAEYLEQLLLFQYVADKTFPVGKPAPATLIAANLRRYFDLLEIPHEPPIRRHVDTLQAACRSGPSV